MTPLLHLLAEMGKFRVPLQITEEIWVEVEIFVEKVKEIIGIFVAENPVWESTVGVFGEEEVFSFDFYV